MNHIRFCEALLVLLVTCMQDDGCSILEETELASRPWLAAIVHAVHSCCCSPNAELISVVCILHLVLVLLHHLPVNIRTVVLALPLIAHLADCTLGSYLLAVIVARC